MTDNLEQDEYWAVIDWQASILAEAIRKGDARIMLVDHRSEMGWMYDNVAFRTIIYSHRHRCEAETVTIVSAKAVLDSARTEREISRLILSGFEQLEADT